jgi:hypothetical protein
MRSLGLVVIVIALAACTGSAGAAVSKASSAPVSAPAVAPSVAASPAAAPAASPGGPVDYAAWVERQGFGGSSGLHQVVNEVHFLHDRPVEVTQFDLDNGLRLVDHLATWLDENPATACWADQHATIRAALGRLHDGYSAARDAAAAGKYVRVEVTKALVEQAEAAYALPAPTGC